MIEIKELAEAIAEELMTFDDTITVERLAMMKKQDDGSEKNIGGRNTHSVIGVIQRRLEDALCG